MGLRRSGGVFLAKVYSAQISSYLQFLIAAVSIEDGFITYTVFKWKFKVNLFWK